MPFVRGYLHNGGETRNKPSNLIIVDDVHSYIPLLRSLSLNLRRDPVMWSSHLPASRHRIIRQFVADNTLLLAALA